MLVKRVYPRWRGEHDEQHARTGVTYGLSPLARGTPLAGDMGVPLERFIPAGAGNTYPACDRDSFPAVYPRWRGEHEVAKYCQRDFFGLSPLARGTRPCEFQSAFSPRFIPAGAGNTLPICKYFSSAAVYPRWRGEHSSLSIVAAYIAGLSPLARGTRLHRG